jgi:hypothetical protein
MTNSESIPNAQNPKSRAGRPGIEQLIIEGLNSGNPIPFTRDHFKKKKNNLIKRCSRKNNHP